jgi:hypothetical protein
MRSLEVLLGGTIDYAGLFPPAKLSMEPAVRNYHAYRGGPYSWALGRFIVPVSRLAEFEDAAAPLLEQALEPWHLSALAGEDPAADIESIKAFNERHARPGAIIDTIEMRADVAGGVEVPGSLEVFVEVPVREDPSATIRTIAGRGRKAKIRTGGITEDMIPTVVEVARFIDACRRHDVAFKATAGLHHPLRAEYPLTYDKGSARATMHGFLNVFVAACFRHAGEPVDVIERILGETTTDAIAFFEGGIAWNGLRMETADVENARRRFALSFGSCSFEEPIEDLKGNNYL